MLYCSIQAAALPSGGCPQGYPCTAEAPLQFGAGLSVSASLAKSGSHTPPALYLITYRQNARTQQNVFHFVAFASRE